ncbi:hypothetical protein [Williamsia sp. R60]
MSEPTHELVDQIPAADWVDQDLLTRDDSAELLRKEIEAEETHLTQIDKDHELSEPDRVAARDLVSRRIEAMKAIRTRLLSTR